MSGGVPMLGRSRDPEWIRDRLTAWLRARRPEAEGLALSVPVTPKVGFSNETFLCEATWRAGGAARRESLVVRLEPNEFLVFPEYDLGRQVAVMRALAATDVPVPRVRWFEEDRTILGSPFYVMDRVDGEVPSEVPCYHAFGFCHDAAPERRARVWWSGVEALARIHRVDWRARGLGVLGEPGGGTDPLDRQLDHYAGYLEWVRRGDPQPILLAALAWLRAHRYVPRRVTLCWGDSRLPNLIFRDDAVVAVLDWEMAFLGDPEADLGWWLFLDWAQSEGYRIPRLPGFPGAEETVRRYEALTGWPVEHARWQEVFAAFRFGCIMARIARRLRETGTPTPTDDFERDNVCTRHLARRLGLPPPGSA
jgi:aminoglycoside phosphotransferase (APT) family kinase protein